MKLGYQTNTWGGVFGHPGGVTSVKDAYYMAGGSTEEAVADIAQAGYQGIELFDGNLMQYAGRIDEFKQLLHKHGQALIGVYTGANFIYEEILNDELYKIEQVAKLAAEAGAEHLVIGGGALRAGGIRESDYVALGKALDRVKAIAERWGLVASYHPHLGSLIEKPEQLTRLMKLTSICLCPDTAHLEAGGSDPVEVIRTYADRIRYVHYKDYANGRFLPLGEGHQRFDEMTAVLREMHYDGWITVELDSHENPLQAAGISNRYLREQLQIGE
ncbi:sugar phosphate isomerase/epimerase [Paenibacillus athensensis]|uniref:Sugar phosphate isomerase n=1 Tax=Paenibacillus athensensis TaxID=1967502 RepID=A0A4Y8PYZ5_9BACL|nr:sugar phosphate isomerase/epimerase [Paenibacillus athensensis]MCD1260405.1 sugar phosphate isomerase/epimerase [Paenibacillus athensensis]